MGEDECGCYTVDVTVGAASITLHGPFGVMTPEVLDTLLARMTTRTMAAAAAYAKVTHEHA